MRAPREFGDQGGLSEGHGRADPALPCPVLVTENVGQVLPRTQPDLHPHQALDKMEKEWSTILFNVLPYKETETYILKSPDEASQLLDDHIVMTQSMSFSPYKKPFEQRINSWETKLKLTQVGPPWPSPSLTAPCILSGSLWCLGGSSEEPCPVRSLAQVCSAPGSLTGPSCRGEQLQWVSASLRCVC